MHEAAITEALVEQVGEFLPQGGLLREVRIDVGEMEHLDPEVMATVWEVVTSGTRLAGARLEFETVKLEIRCRTCGHGYAPEDPAILVCPGCGAATPEVLQGSGVVLRSLEVEEP